MKAKTSELGTNRTGLKASPVDSKRLIEEAERTPPSSPGDASGIWTVRQEFARETGSVGSMPPPPTLKGAAKAAMEALKGGRATVFLNKLGERIGFERTGARLYEAALSKLEVHGTWKGGPSRDQLEKIRRDELAHFSLLTATMEKLGGDPTALTPCANLASVMSEGIPKVLVDPRTNLLQCLEALLVAELTDNASWELLITLARQLGHDNLAEDFQLALDAEQEHLMLVKGWLTAGTRLEAQVGEQAAGAPV